MVRKADRVFLENMVHFTHMGHAVASQALYDAGASPKRVAGLVHREVEVLSDEAAIKKAGKTSGRIQEIVVAKIFAEFIGSIEDLGALCYAIRDRKNKSIFKAYAISFDEPNDFFEEIIANADAISDLAEVLDIPYLNELKDKIPPDVYEALEKAYDKCTRQIKGAAFFFRNMGRGQSAAPNPDEVVYIIFDTVDKDRPPRRPPSRGISVRVYNKTKHRFLVFDDIQPLLKAMDEEDVGMDIGYTTLSLLSDDVQAIKTMTMGIAQCKAEIAFIMTLLEDQGVTV